MSDEEIRALAEALGISEEAAAKLTAAAAADGTELPNGDILTV